jgi:hypothetical protein
VICYVALETTVHPGFLPLALLMTFSLVAKVGERSSLYRILVSKVPESSCLVDHKIRKDIKIPLGK